MTYSNWKVNGRTREGLDELNVLSMNEHRDWHACHDPDIQRTPDTDTFVVFIDEL